MKFALNARGAGVAVLAMAAVTAQAALTEIPQSALTPSTTYYTDTIGSGIGSTQPWTGGSPRSSDPIRNDDAYFKIDLGYTFTLFGTAYDSLYVNTNGNVSFNSGISAYIPLGPIGADQPVVSAWFGDVDTRNAATGGVYVLNDSVAQQLIVTWDQVGYYNNHGDKLNSFQLVLRGDGYVVPDGEGTVGFWWKAMDWEDTDTSTTAAIGFGTGTVGDGFVLEGTNAVGLAPVVANHHIWFDTSSGSVVVPPPVPEPETVALMLAGLGVVAARLRRRSA
jgi:hypothetical protein